MITDFVSECGANGLDGPIETAHRKTAYMERKLTFLALSFTGFTDHIFSLGVF
jgi:hypothetical protein